jgi:hypothetical protein
MRIDTEVAKEFCTSPFRCDKPELAIAAALRAAYLEALTIGFATEGSTWSFSIEPQLRNPG